MQHAFLYISLLSLHDFDVKLPNFTFCGGLKQQDKHILFPELRYCLLEFNSRKNCQHLRNWTRWNKRGKVWSTANWKKKLRFRNRRRRCCLNSLLTLVELYQLKFLFAVLRTNAFLKMWRKWSRIWKGTKLTAVILVFQNNKQLPWCFSKPVLWEFNSFLKQTLSFV